MKRYLILLFIISAVFFKAQTTYYQQQADYDMYIDVDVKNYQYKGKQIINYTNNSPDTLNVFFYHLYWNAFQPGSMMDQKIDGTDKHADERLIDENRKSRIKSLKTNEMGYQKVKSLKQDGINLKFFEEETVLKVELAKPILPNTKVVFEMEWDSQVPQQIRRSGRNNSEGIEFTMTQWYPKVVEYDYDGWHTYDYVAREFHEAFGNYDVKINIDKDYVIGAGGVLQNPEKVKGYSKTANPKSKKGKTEWHFKAENILDFAWAADTDYTVESFQAIDGPLVYYVYQKSEKTKYWEESKPKVKEFYRIMNNRFGKYPYPTYSFIQGGDGGMEYGMCTMILGESKTLEDLTELMFHEASHSWFQQVLATNENMRAWMDEGFTSYAVDVCMAQIFPDIAKGYPNPNYSAIYSYIEFAKSGEEETMGLLADHFKKTRAYLTAAYTKGDIFLVQLGYIVGEKNLTKIMKEYFKTWKFKHPTDRDFFHIAQKVSGMDLKWYWNYITYTTRQIDYSIKEVKQNNEKITVVLENLGDFPIPIDVYVVYKNNEKVEIYNIPLNVMRGTKEQEFAIPQINMKPWRWTQKQYEFEINSSLENIETIMIDITGRITDVNFDNNVYKK